MSEEHSLQDIEQENLEPGPQPAEDVPPSGAVPSDGDAMSVEQLRIALGQALKKADENWDKLVRTQAEMENLRRRTEKDLQNAHKYALERFAKELLVVLDSLELGIQAASAESADLIQVREGSELTLKQCRSVLEKFNVLPVDPLGQKFNPDLHQAMAMEPSTSAEPNTVVKVFQKGYVLNDRLLRPAMVVIAQAVAEQPRVDEKA